MNNDDLTVREKADLVSRIRALSAPMTPRASHEAPRLASWSGIRAVLFDVYGTLLISGSGDIGTVSDVDRPTALAASLAAAEFPGDLTVAAVRGVAALRDAIAAEHDRKRAAGVDYPEVDIREIWKKVLGGLSGEEGWAGAITGPTVRRMAIEFECRVNPVWPMPGMREAVAALSARGIDLGIVSNAQFYTPLLFPALLQKEPEDLGFAGDLCIWSYRMGQAKPAPALFAALDAARRRRGWDWRDCVYVGNDVLNDVRTASETGCRTVLFAGDARSLRWREDDPRCRDVRPDAVITDLCQLPEIIA